MYNNEEASPAFSAFLELLGEQVLLKGFTKYAAQLDTKSKHFQTCTSFCTCDVECESGPRFWVRIQLSLREN